jgi:hypothetical protein
VGVVAQGGGEVDRPRSAEHPDREVAQGRHDLRGGAGAELAGVLGVGGIADVCRPFSTAQCPRRRSARRAGLAWANGRLVMA